jgi:hypothetical protein
MIGAATPEDISFFSRVASYSPSGYARGIKHVRNKGGAAMVLFDHWTPSAAQVHVWSSDLGALFDPVFLGEIFAYPFITHGKLKLISVTPENQKGSLAVSGWLGFREVARIHDAWDVGVSMVVKELYRQDCRFIRKKITLAS